ncbi:putative cyclophilin [Schistosoma mansoni]|uniref:Peptidyl-prolyl cis-trans isomerase n=1 Tax=Schistosoma mansoni TaxID=6183 RepID=G4VQK3_SCHMA|nr:putative cyclophilin [Schistosoma mansoni]|eukprot:XP_018655148.1 putative cyclophilin [Schistosoma mansoni]
MIIEIYGLVHKESFQKARLLASDLHESHHEIFEQPKICEMFEFEWADFIKTTKKKLGGAYWIYNHDVLVIIDGNPLGSEKDLENWVETEFNVTDYRPMTLYSSLALDAYQKRLLHLNRIHVSMHISVDGEKCGILLLELYSDIVPRTCENFRSLCTGEYGVIKKNEVEKYKMNYKGTKFFRLVKNGWIQGGDILYNRGDDGRSIYGPVFEDENFIIKHDRRGILSMANSGRHTNGSQFLITLAPAEWMDNHYVAFGSVIEGSLTLDKMEEVSTQYERPLKDICIEDISIVNANDLTTKIV